MTRPSWLKTLRQLINCPWGHRTGRRLGGARHRPTGVVLIEILDPRALLSGSPIAGQSSPTSVGLNPMVVAHPDFILFQPVGKNGSASPLGTSAPSGTTPAQMRQAYGMGLINFGGVAGDGSGQTIAIVDAYDDPTAIPDLAAFDAFFGLSNPPSFKVLNQTGGTNRPGTDPSGPGGWSVEESLDIEWAHVMAPKANIILFEANDNSYANLFAAVDTARNYSGVSTVSMSFGGGEFSGVTAFDSHFLTPNGHQGVTFIASTGDSGAPGGYPALSPNVVAVGGTTLSITGSGNYLGESGWSGSGGGYSNYEKEPAYQKGVQKTGRRSIPDVSMDADPNSGVPVYDTFDFGASSPWEQVGGTSLAAPMFAGVIAVVDQGRVAASKTTFDGSTQTLPALYQLPAADYHDIKTGNNGFSAGKGYDLVTGIGSPVANKFVPDLVNGITVVIISPPSLSGIETNPLAYSTNGPALNIASTIVINDPSSATLTGAIIQFTKNYSANRDVLTFVDTPKIKGVFYYATGRLILTGTATVAEYQAALRSITFKYIGRLPSSLTRTLSFQVSDSSDPNDYNSNVVTRDVTVR